MLSRPAGEGLRDGGVTSSVKIGPGHAPGSEDRPGGGERRREPRVPGGPDGLSLWVPDLAAEAAFVDRSVSGLGLILPRRARVKVGNRLLVELVSSGTSFARLSLDVRTRAPWGDAWRVGGFIANAAALPTGPQADLPADARFELVDEAVVGEVLTSLYRLRPRLTLELGGGRELAADLLDKGIAARPEGIELVPRGVPAAVLDGAEAVVGVALHDASFTLEGRLRATHEGTLVLPLPCRVFSRGRRTSGRTRVPPGTLGVRLAHPLLAGSEVTAEVVELSPRGLVLSRFAGGPPVPPGPMPGLRMTLFGREAVFHARVRHAGQRDGEAVVGVELVSAGTGDWLRLFRFWSQTTFPLLVSRSEVPRALLDELLVQSGYLDLRAGIGPTETWYTPPGDERLSLDIVCNSPEGIPGGHLSCLRIYRYTWMYHQLASVGKGLAASEGRRALYLHTIAWLGSRDDDHRYAMAWFNREKAWHRVFFDAFASWMRSDEMVVIAPYDRFERTSTPAAGFEPDDSRDGETVGDLGPEDRVEAAALAASQVPALVAGAFDLDPVHVDAPHLCTQHSARGLVRGRKGFVIRDGAGVAGIALCETGSRDLSLFNLLNIAHVYLRLGDAAPSAAAQIGLLDRVLAYYAERGQSRPIVIAPPGTLTCASRAGFELAETMGCIVFSRHAARQYRNFLAFQFGRFMEKRGDR